MNGTKILVAYTSVTGSTQEIAQYIAEELTNQGMEAVIKPCRSVKDLENFDAIVLGAPLYMFRWHNDAKQFLRRHRNALSRLPVAVFAGGPFGENAAKDAVEVRKNLDSELAKYPWLTPVSVLLVGGRFDPTRLRFPYNLIPGLKLAPASDVRDWDEIRGWAQRLTGILTQVDPKSTPA